MKILSTSFSRSNRAYALLIVMTFMGIMLVLFGAMLFDTLSNANLTKRNNQYNASEGAAQAATEKVLSQMTHDFEFESLSNNGNYYGATFTPTISGDEADWPIKYYFSGTNGTTTNQQISVNIGSVSTYATNLNSQYSGLYGFVQNCTLTATATPTNSIGVSSTVCETVQFAQIPLFQFAIFYNMNLEIAAAQTLNIVGAVYSNGGLWSGTTTVTFSSTVSSVGEATNEADDPFCAGYSGSGRSTYSIAGQPTSGNDTITMPIGTNNNPSSVEAIVNIPPTTYQMNTAAAFTTNGLLYLANAADLFLTNAAFGTNFGGLKPLGSSMALYYEDGANSPYMCWVTNDYYLFTNHSGSVYTAMQTNSLPRGFSLNLTNNLTAITWTNNPAGTNQLFFAGYSFLTNVLFTDAREGWHGGSGPAKPVQTVQIDLQKFNLWLTNTLVNDPNSGTNWNALCNLSNHKSHPIDSIYIFNGVPLTTNLPAVRIVNGGMLPPDDGGYGFTLATAQPLYILGDYNASNTLGSSLNVNNCIYTEPAGLMADAVTILSDGWSDTNTQNQLSGGPTAKSTTINAACLEGIVESNTNNPASSSSSKGYSGGVENFLRTLENWSGANLYYSGSIIVMFPSQYATNCWQQTGGYYTAPSRHWAFDTNFNISADLPPLTPRTQGVIRGSWIVN